MKRIVLRPGRERSVLLGHPWIFSGAVADGEAGPGETVEVVSSRGERLGYASFSPASQIRARMLSAGADAPVPDDGLVAARVAAAVSARDWCEPGSKTRAVRLINAESDFRNIAATPGYLQTVVRRIFEFRDFQRFLSG